MKIPKVLVKNADGTKTLHRPHKLAIDELGNLQRWSTAGPIESPLPPGWRWATAEDFDAEQIDNEFTA